MCELCLRETCVLKCPNYEPEEYVVECDDCAQEICEGEKYFCFDEVNICSECVAGYVEANFGRILSSLDCEF